VWLVGYAAAAGGVAEILVEQFLALFPALGIGQSTDLGAHLAALNAEALSAHANVPALSIGVSGVSFLACALCAWYAFNVVPDGVGGAGAFWCACGFVAGVSVFVAGAFAWACLEGSSASAYDSWLAVFINRFLDTLVSTDHVRALYAWNWYLLLILVEFAVVQAWAVHLLDASAVQHDCSFWALATSVALRAALGWTRFQLRHMIAGLVAETLAWNQWAGADKFYWCGYWCCS